MAPTISIAVTEPDTLQVSPAGDSIRQGAATTSYDELENTDVIIAWGSNTQECHPIIFNHMRRGIKNGAKMIVIDPREIGQTKIAHKWLPVRVGY